MNLICIFCAITTIFSNKMYSTVCAVRVDAPAEVSDTIFARFVSDFQSSPDALFDWAFYGVGTQDNQERNAFLLDYKNTVYIPEKNYGNITLDVIVPGFIRIKNIFLEADVIDERDSIRYTPNLCIDSLTMQNIPDFNRHFDIRVTSYSGKLLEKGFGNIYILPIDSTHSAFLMDINIKYGWFFNMFINMKSYKNSVEWRVNKYMQNLKRVAEELYADEQIL